MQKSQDSAGQQSARNNYQPYGAPVNRNTVLTFGRYAGKAIKDVPAQYLIDYVEVDWNVKNLWLCTYITATMDLLKVRAQNEKAETKELPHGNGGALATA